MPREQIDGMPTTGGGPGSGAPETLWPCGLRILTSVRKARSHVQISLERQEEPGDGETWPVLDPAQRQFTTS